MDFQELADEAFRDLLRKHQRPVDLESALRQSAGKSASIHKFPRKNKDRPASGRLIWPTWHVVADSSIARAPRFSP
jgi:hypothetical protein